MPHDISARALARLHRRGFERGWRVSDFETYLSDPACVIVARPEGFVLARVALDEAEILAITVDARHRRQGLARLLLGELFSGLRQRGVSTILLEVAQDNSAALALYAKAGFAAAGCRKAYYPRRDADPADALILRKSLIQLGDSPRQSGNIG